MSSHYHLTNERDTFYTKKHSLGSSETNALSAVFVCFRRVFFIIGVRPDSEVSILISPAEEYLNFSTNPWLYEIDLSNIDVSNKSIEREQIPLFDGDFADLEEFLCPDLCAEPRSQRWRACLYLVQR